MAYRYTTAELNGVLRMFRYEESNPKSVEIFNGISMSWISFTKPENFRFAEPPYTLIGKYWCKGGEQCPVHGEEDDFPKAPEGETGLDAFIRIMEAVHAQQIGKLARIRATISAARSIKNYTIELVLMLIVLASSAYCSTNQQNHTDLIWYSGDRVDLIDKSNPEGGYFREMLETVYQSGFNGAIVDLNSKNTGWVGSQWQDTLDDVLSRFDTTNFKIILQTRNVSKHSYGSPAPVPTNVSSGLRFDIDTFAVSRGYGERFFIPLNTVGMDYRLFDLVVHSTGACRAYILRKTEKDPTVYRADFVGTDTLTFHTLDNSTKYTLMLQCRDRNGSIDMGLCGMYERDPYPEEVKSYSQDTYDFIGMKGDGFYYSRTVDVEDRTAVWKSYEPSRELALVFGHHPCIKATWHSADEVFMFGHQKFRWFNSGGEAYTFLLDEGVRFDNLIWNRPVWMWADHRSGGHNTLTPYERASINMNQVYNDSGLNQKLIAWNEGDLTTEVRRMHPEGMAVTLGTDNIDSSASVARECNVGTVVFEAWSDYSVGSTRRKWLTKLPEIVSKFRRQ